MLLMRLKQRLALILAAKSKRERERHRRELRRMLIAVFQIVNERSAGPRRAHNG